MHLTASFSFTNNPNTLYASANAPFSCYRIIPSKLLNISIVDTQSSGNSNIYKFVTMLYVVNV